MTVSKLVVQVGPDGTNEDVTAKVHPAIASYSSVSDSDRFFTDSDSSVSDSESSVSDSDSFVTYRDSSVYDSRQ